jgi:hypothetical protein
MSLWASLGLILTVPYILLSENARGSRENSIFDLCHNFSFSYNHKEIVMNNNYYKN